MATVYRAVDTHLGRPVALKLLKNGDPEDIPRFLLEARAQAQIDHENVCRVYEAGEMYGQSFIAMQYIDGKPLSDVIGELTLEQRVAVIRQVATALHEAHRLGIIHRDIKPANILIERPASGALKPYVVDFGLARHVGERGQTRTGVVVGTLRYMPPEQARGDWQVMDRRSDVFSLGATLFELVAGRPPFVSDQPMRLLLMVSYEDAPRLGSVKEGVPPALETIVTKCLERDPARRFESARALADDLQRFLDGERIEARPPTLARVLGKKARRHKVATAVLGVLLAASLVLAGGWLYTTRRAADQARIAHDLGAGVKEMELFLRAAHGMPLHDVERERALVRERLLALSGRLASSGAAGEGPGHCAIGQGHLALGDPEAARDHLEKALAAGYSSPELRYALGRALAELFRRAVVAARRIGDQEERSRAIEQLTRELRDPALSHLRAAAAAQIEVPAYAEGLIALCEGKNEEAASRAREAFAKAPWMYEAKKLEGDALFAEGSRYRHDAAFDAAKMAAYFAPAAQAYSEARDLGRSDPDVHLAECELLEKVGWAALNEGTPFAPSFEAADAACGRAMGASSNDGRAVVQRALVLAAHAYAESDPVTERALALAEDALDLAEQGVALRPADPMAHYAVALSLSLRAQALHALGQEPSMVWAIDAYDRVLAMEPRFAWAHNELGEVYGFEARWEEERGHDGSAWTRKAMAQLEQAIAIDPRFTLPVIERLRVLAAQIESSIGRRRDPEEALSELSAAAAALDEVSFAPWLRALWQARAHRLRALRDLTWGRDPTSSLSRALGAIHAVAGDPPADPWLAAEAARCQAMKP